jgi:hypothetical protein
MLLTEPGRGEMASKYLATVAVLATAIGAPTWAFAAGASDPCQVMLNAMIAQLKQSFAASTLLIDGKGPDKHSEARLVGGKFYVQTDGKWRVTTLTRDLVVDALTASWNTAKACKADGPGAVDGEPAAIFEAKVADRGGESFRKLWISNASALPLEAETHFADGTAMVQTYSYSNVTAP